MSTSLHETMLGHEKRWASDLLEMHKADQQRLDDLQEIIESVRAIHTPKPLNKIGVDAFAQWWCTGCNRQWPCETWQATAPEYEFPSQLKLEWRRRS